MKEDAGGNDGWWRMKYMPELGRIVLEKTRNFEADYNDVWESLQVLRLEEIVQNGGETYICVRKM